jgi:ABC-type Zn uptake system ZnuABC Zn-binding protein ZnuA/Ca2+-binding EF-hand superfamily protein
MNKKASRALFVSLIMIFSSLAGCLGDEANGDGDDSSTQSLGKVMVSTYHIGELVKGIAGETVDMEYMSLANIPVHDYEPSASDLIRLQNSDVFFYHGLGLEPWVESTLDSLGDDAPTSIEVHTMPTGQETLDYEGVLITDLCETLSEGPLENIELADEEEHADDAEIHAEYTAFNMSFHHDEHDDHDEGDDHDDHDEGDDHDSHEEHDDHDDHDSGHEGHAHAEAEETIVNPEGCPADSIISIFHLEEGEYVLEFDATHPEDFKMAILKMGGGHAHHDHGDHDDHGDEDEHGDDDHGDEHGVCHDMSDHTNNDIDNEEDCEAGGFIWMEEDEHDDHDGDVCHDTTSHANTNHSTEEECEAAGHMWMEGDDHDDHHDEEMTADHMLEMFDANNDSHLSWDEFWGAWEEDHDDDHADNESHDENETHDESETHDEHDDEHMEELLMWMFNQSDMNSDNLLNLSEIGHVIEMMNSDTPSVEEMLIMADSNDDEHISWEEFIESWEEDDHDEHDEEGMVCYNMSSHTIDSGYTTQADCEGAGLTWTAANSGSSHGEEDGHDAHDEHEEEMLMEMFNESDMNSDGLLNASELEHFIEDIDAWENPPMGYVTLHVEAEGEYGFAHPADLEFHVVMAGDGHDDHDDHAGHDDHADEEDDHDDHADEEDDLDDHEGEDGNHSEESLNYDPHSWLSPLAFNAQVTVVMNALTTAFPDGENDFKANAETYSAQLTALDVAFDAAFGTDGLCMAGGYDKTVAANHIAYSYIAVEYDIKFMTVHGLDPEGEPSPEDIAKVVDFIKEEGITVLFVEEYTDQSSVQSIVDETGVEIKILYTMEMAPRDSSDDYLSMMTKNLDNLVSGIGC